MTEKYEYPFNSPVEIKRVMAEAQGAVRKRWGQNFLTDPNQARRISELILEVCPEAGAELVEIGPGLGALTHRLLLGGRKVQALEIDPLLCEILEGELGRFPEFNLRPGDAREFLKSQETLPWVVGNLPYYITTELLIASCRAPGARGGVFLTQKEFAERAAAGDSRSSLGIFIQNFGQWKLEFTVGPGAFYPRPSVDSAVMSFRARPEGPICDVDLLERLLRMSFGGKRKKIRNAWKKGVGSEQDQELFLAGASALNIDLDLRAEQIPPERFYELVQWGAQNT